MPRVQHKRGTSANLASVNPTPLAGELVWDSTENAIKFGDGATAWSSLAYVTATPRSHVHDGADITTGTVAYARLPVGSTASTVCAGDDARLTDARTPTAHKASHATGGSDALAPSDIGAAPAANPTFTGVVAVPAGSGAAPSIVSSVTNSAGIFFPSADVVAISTAGASRVRVGADGNVGIGKTATQTLDVNGVIASLGGSAGAPSQTFTGDPDSGIFSAGANTFAVATGGSERLRVDSSGRLGIATTSPASTLHVNGTIRATNLTDGTTTKTITEVLAGGGGGGTFDFQEFTSSGTWTKPAGCTVVLIELVGGGGGGGSGARYATTSARGGGGGGAGGAFVRRWYLASELSATVAVTVGAGGAGGAAATTDTTNGNVGSAGGATTFGSGATTGQAGGGSPGTNSATGGAGGAISGWAIASYNATAGGGAAQTIATNALTGAAGGGGSQGVAANITSGGFGGRGGVALSVRNTTTGASSGSGAGVAGGAWSGGSGGSYLTAAAGRDGGAGGLYGGGGGGGSASDNGFVSGKGGDGAAGLVRVWSW